MMNTETLEAHLSKRRLLPDLYGGITVDSENDIVTFPLWNLSGQMVGFQQYRRGAPKACHGKPSEQKYFTLLSKAGGRHSMLSCFGLDLLGSHSKVVFLGEGVLDISPLHLRKANALAVLMNDPKPLKRWLRSWGYHLVALCEGDKAGRKLANVAHESVYLPEGQDPGDQPNSWFDNLVANYS
ncbi:hypothetical protein AB835_08290 [Candidatus Endobugula sertula]|uniref:Toprim domain-containing protein n=1 Tax=Candidatus Endobugula sertula TaxID=62101 RepID=A0A1D2QPV5_9GAMM|nr:hypothetical protein AB835_08290 [Candidatus Endobugula sertula]